MSPPHWRADLGRVAGRPAWRRRLAGRAAGWVAGLGFTLGATWGTTFGAAAAPAAPACPNDLVRIIVPVVAGGPLDSLARALAARLEQSGGQRHVVENRSGGMTIPAWDAVAKAAPDGCTLLIASTSGRTVLPFQATTKLPFDPARDLVPVTPLADVPQLFVAHAASGIRSLADLVARARRDPGGVAIAIPTPGAITHLATLSLQREAGIRLNEVPYRGGAPAAQAVRSGEVAAMSADVGAVLPLVRSGDLVALATASASRLPQLPEVPTVAEAGFPILTATNVYAMFAPAGLPAAALAALHERVVAAMAEPRLRAPLVLIGMVPRVLAPAAFEAELREQQRQMEPLARAAALLVN